MKCFVFALLSLSILACGGDDDSATAGPGSPGATGTGASGGSGGGSGGMSTSSATTGGNGGGVGGGAGGANPACDALPPGPLTPEVALDIFDGSEDIAFDGKGHIAGKKGNTVVLVDAQGQSTDLADLPGTVYGLRYAMDGNLIAALPQAGKLVQIAPDGTVTDYVTGLGGPNGIFPDFDGNVWVTEFGGNKVTQVMVDKTKNPIVTGAEATAANGVVLDAGTMRLFYTEYTEGKVRRVDLGAPGSDPGLVAEINNASLDGMVMDACGNLYVMDQGNSDLYRIKLDAGGGAVGEPELLASFPQNVANAQFGSGDGFEENVLYAAGNPGVVYKLAVGVAGAKVPTAP